MILSTPEFQTALRNDSTKADTSKDSTVDGCSFFPVLEEDPTPSSPEQTMTPLESVFAQAVKRNRQEEEECDSPSSKKPRRYRRIPCKARGILSASHNSNTAFFDIPLDASHGMLLSCSHPECSGSGRRFRWCNGKCCLCSGGACACQIQLVHESISNPQSTSHLQSVKCLLQSATF